MKPTTSLADVTTASIGNTALSLSFNDIQRNRHNRFELDLSNATVIGVLQAYQEKERKRNPRYNLANHIAIIREIEEAARIAAENSIGPDGQRKEWAGPFLPIDINDVFWNLFETYMLTTPSKNGKCRKASTAKGYYNSIVSALDWSQKFGVRLDPSYRDHEFSKYKKKKITPTHDQISLIYHFDLDVAENRKKIRDFAMEMNIRNCSITAIKKVRDHFVLSCSLGQRISDSKRIDPSNFTGNVFETTQQKTGNHAKVDLQECAIDFDVAKEILERYHYYAPAYGMDTNRFNRLLHLLCRTIGGPFLKEISWENKVCGEMVKETVPLWELYTSHIARRTFITNEVNKGKSLPEVMRESGHSDARNMSIYYAPDHK